MPTSWGGARGVNVGIYGSPIRVWVLDGIGISSCDELRPNPRPKDLGFSDCGRTCRMVPRTAVPMLNRCRFFILNPDPGSRKLAFHGAPAFELLYNII